MISRSPSAFTKTVQLTNAWLDSIGRRVNWDDRERSYIALRSTLRALRDRLSVNEAVHLGAQLPMLVRGFYYDGWHPAGTPIKERTKDQFLDHVRRELRGHSDFDVELVVRAVFAVVDEHVTGGEILDIKKTLPREIRELWP
jgi:uncharacterized protein (DUF2267 family)